MEKVILVSIDNLRYDCVGYQPDRGELKKYGVLKYLETPTLDGIAEKSLCFTQCISTGTFTTSVHASILTGLYPPRHGVRPFYEKRLHNDVYTLAEILSLFGYETVLSTDIPQLFDPVNLNRGFNHFFFRNDEELYKFLTTSKDRKVFLFMHFFDVHEPFMFSEYEVYPDYNRDFYEVLDVLYRENNLELPPKVGANNVHMLWRNFNEHRGKRDVNILFPYYVRGVSKFDKGRFRYFIDKLKEIGYLEDSLLIIFSDHGEGRVYEDDLDYFGHSGGLYENVIRVPLILYAHGLGSRVITEPVSLIDIFPTLISLSINKKPADILPYETEGVILTSERREWTYSEAWQMDEKTDSLSFISSSLLLQRAIRTGNRKYILYGRPEFINRRNIENLSNNELVKGLYRSLLYRFESYDEYKKMIDLLNNGYPRDELIKDFLNSKEYLSKVRVAIFDLNDDLKERYNCSPLNPSDLPQNISEYIGYIFKIEGDGVNTDDIFPPLDKEKIRLIVERVFNEKHKYIIESIAEDKHLFLNLIDSLIIESAEDKPDEFINKICSIFPFLEMDEVQKDHYVEMLEKGVTKTEVFNTLLISSGRLRSFLIEDGKEVKEDIEDTEINKRLMLKEAEIESLRARLNQIQSSVTWRIGSKIIYLIDNVFFPAGTRRGWFFQKLMEKLRRTFAKETIKEVEAKSPELPVYQQSLSIGEITPLEFKRVENPRVSIIIPVFNNWVYTYNCLKSIHENSPDGLYEVVIVDDASTDHTQEMLQKVDGITVVKNEDNLGFINSCNKGAKAARGEFILFLNNDTIVLKNWLESLIRTMEEDSRVGIVGSKQISPDRKLLEAGIIVFKDGSAHQYGITFDPARPEFNYLREVDVVSGACLMIRRPIWEELGGFDRGYTVAYYEDMDICFAVRELGYKVMYQPRSEIIHFSGATHERISNVRKSFEEENRIRFREKWFKKFREHPKRIDIYKARERGKRKYILVIMYTTPRPDQQSGFLRTYNMLKILNNNGYKITLLPDDLERLSPYTKDLQELGIEVLYGNINVNGYLRRNGRYFDITLMIRPEVSYKYLSLVKKYLNNSKIIYDTVDLHFLRELRRAEVEGSSEVMAEVERLKNIELTLSKESDLVITVTEDDKEALLREMNKDIRVAVIPNIHKVNPLEKPFNERKDILFIGGFKHKPNIDAVFYFAKEIFPIIKERINDMRFYVVGSNPPPELFELQSMDIIITGYVKDIEPFFENCKLSVAPLRYGAGIKGKITQSMSLGLPVVTTSIGAEGMKGVDGEVCLIADTPEDFAEKLVRLYSDEHLWQSIRGNAIRYVKDNLSIKAIEKRILRLFEDFD